MGTADKESLSYRIPAYGQHVVAALFNPERWDCQLVALGNGLPDEGTQENYKARGLCLVAVFGFLQGRFCSAFECPLEDSAVSYLARCYTEHLYRTLVTEAPTKKAADAAVDWLRALYALPSEDRSREN